MTAKFLLSHPELKQILIIEAKGAVKLACITVRRLSGHDKLDLFQSFDAFEAACTSGRAGARRRAALHVARSLRSCVCGSLSLAGFDAACASCSTQRPLDCSEPFAF